MAGTPMLRVQPAAEEVRRSGRVRRRRTILWVFNRVGLLTYSVWFGCLILGHRLPLEIAAVLCAILFAGQIYLYQVLRR